MTNDLEDLVSIIKKIANGQVKMFVVGEYQFQDAYSGNILFKAGDWEITIFCDCGDYDYIDNAKSPSGKVYEYEDIYPDKDHIEAILDDEVHDKFVKAVYDAPLLNK